MATEPDRHRLILPLSRKTSALDTYMATETRSGHLPSAPLSATAFITGAALLELRGYRRVVTITTTERDAVPTPASF